MKSKLLLFGLLFMLIFIPRFAHATGAGAFTFTLPQSATTSAGVYDPSGTLIRTLWSNVKYNAGTYTKYWDGTDDFNNAVSTAPVYSIKVLSDNVQYTWEGVVGNTSASFTGPTVIHDFRSQGFNDMAIVGNTAYYGTGYSEAAPAEFKFNTSNPQVKQYLASIPPVGNGTAQDTLFVASDGTNVYWGGGDANSSTHNVFVFATKVSDDSMVSFANGVSYTPVYGRNIPSTIDLISSGLTYNDSTSGMAVQKTHNYLFVANANLNQVHVLDKTTGALVQTLAFTNPGRMAVDSSDNLWMINSNGVQKFTVNSNGTLSAPLLTLPNLVAPMAVAVSPDGVTVVVADGGNSQQLKAYNNATGVTSWTYGQAGGYSTDATVANDKFIWKDSIVFGAKAVNNTYVSFAPDGSFWVGDQGNRRAMHFSTNRTFIEQIQNLNQSYSVQADPNNPTRVFEDYLEFAVDYSKPLDNGVNGSWKLIRNWGGTVNNTYDNHNWRLLYVTTLSNGRTYAMGRNGSNNTQVLIELQTNGQLRYITSNIFPNLTYSLYADGSLWYLGNTNNNAVGSPTSWIKQPLIGFDASNNPIWGTAVTMASLPSIGFTDPVSRTDNGAANQVTSSGILGTFQFQGYSTGDTPASRGYTYHLGGIPIGSTNFSFKTSVATQRSYEGDFPNNGDFDMGNTSNGYAGGFSQALGNSIFWTYHGEFWKQSQTNMYNQYYDNGLMVGQFGVAGPIAAGNEAPAGMAGNALTGTFVKDPLDPNSYYLYHCDESWHGGIHRWKISGLNTISTQTATYPSPTVYVPPAGANLNAGLPYSSTLTATDAWSRTGIESTNWTVSTNTDTNDRRSPDVSGALRGTTAGTYDITKDLGTNSGVSSWSLAMSYATPKIITSTGPSISNAPTFSTATGSYLDVLDAAGKIISRFYDMYTTYPTAVVKGNSAVIASFPSNTLGGFQSSYSPLTISASATGITFAYGNFAPVTTPVFDSTSNWKNPKMLRMEFITTGSSVLTMDVGNAHFLTSASATPPPVLTPPLLFSTTTPSFPSGTTSMNLSVTTNIPAMCGYSNTANTPYGAMTRFSTTGGTAHSTLISGLTNGTTYTYYVRCADATTSTNVDTTDYPITFSVAAPMLAPLLYSTTPPTYPNSTTTVTLAITTNVIATCAYSPTANTPYASMIRFSNTGSTTHTTTVTGLTDGTSYTYYVRCAGTSNTVNTVDYPIAFAIAAPTVTVPVAPLLYTTTALSFPSGTNSTTLTIVSNMAALCGYSTVANTPYGSMTRFSTTGGTTHTTLLSNLTDGTSYTYYVRCADASNSTNVDTVDYPVAFSIAFPTVIILPPVITSTVATTLPSGTTSTALTVTTTANATCAYSATANTPYSAMTSFTSTGGTTHTTLLSNLTDGTSYTYYVRCAGTSNTVNTVDYPIAFAIAFPVAGTPPPTPAPAGGGGAGGASSSSSTPTSTAPATPTTPSDCTPGVAFSVSTGTACPSVATIPPTPAPVSGNTSQLNGGGLSLTQTLVLGARSPEVQLLQQYLNTHGFQVAITGPGSSGNETAYFGPATKGAVQKFQSVAGLAPVDGVVGPKTRAVLAGTPLTAIIPTPAALPSTASRVRVTATAINLRATIGGTIVGRISHNTVGTVLTRIPSANGLYWVQVQFPTVTGWTSSLYLTSTTMTKPATPTKPASATATPASGHLVVTAATLTLYATPSTSATSITTLTRGTQGTLTATSGTWDQGIFAGVKGWVEQGGVVIY